MGGVAGEVGTRGTGHRKERRVVAEYKTKFVIFFPVHILGKGHFMPFLLQLTRVGTGFPKVMLPLNLITQVESLCSNSPYAPLLPLTPPVPTASSTASRARVMRGSFFKPGMRVQCHQWGGGHRIFSKVNEDFPVPVHTYLCQLGGNPSWALLSSGSPKALVRKRLRQGSPEGAHPQTVLGQEQDSHGGKCEERPSFVRQTGFVQVGLCSVLKRNPVCVLGCPPQSPYPRPAGPEPGDSGEHAHRALEVELKFCSKRTKLLERKVTDRKDQLPGATPVFFEFPIS